MIPDHAEHFFPNHRGVVPMLAVFAGLACLELVAVHLFLAIQWPRLAWLLSALSAAAILWLLWWIRSWKRLPHRLASGKLTVHMGSLRHLCVAVEDIRSIRTAVNDSVIKVQSCRNLVPIAYPNRLIELNAPMQDRRATEKIAIRVDDPAAFDRAMQRAGIMVRP